MITNRTSAWRLSHDSALGELSVESEDGRKRLRHMVVTL